ncbi:Isoniazid-inducible protein iniA [Pseudonocardia sp. K10HN5]|uniref:Isoniazid-inducible protein iniA n=1 Tax=Pseudonocardia acidicola TaxID=2724939 RepID=A0ABX1SJD1_9PSEU|nr:Isoniazid-inducible protein iniA [Pseudonocardia acidicola]
MVSATTDVAGRTVKNTDFTESPAELLDELRTLTAAAGRADLDARLSLARERVCDPRLRIVVTGESRKGMSSLVGSIVGADMTAVAQPGTPVVVCYGETESTRLVTSPGSGEVTELAFPSGILADGVVFVDMPGTSGEDSGRAASTLATLPTADAVLFVSDAGREYTAPEIAYLSQIRRICPMVICVINKIDVYPRWADIQKANRKHLNDAGLDLPLLPVSSAMRELATRTGDAELDVESGVPQLLNFLRDTVIAGADAVARNAVVNDVRVVSDHVALALNTELDALNDPRRSAELVERMCTARDAADRLRQRTANWQYTLGDGVTELVVDIEHDLRHRLRTVVREAEADIMKSDPAKRWAAFGSWLDGRISECVCDNFVMAHTRSMALADEVAATFAEEGHVPLPELHIADTGSVLDPVQSLEALESGKAGILQRVITSMRGSYGGILMVGVLTSLAGLALVNPWSIGAGVLLGANTFYEDRKALKARRQAEAKVAVARLMDDVVFQVSKESKFRLRQVQRTLRDHFTEVAGEMLRSADEALRAAQEANQIHENRRAARMDEIQDSLSRLRQLRVRAAGFATVPGATR